MIVPRDVPRSKEQLGALQARAQTLAALIVVHPNWTRLKARNPSAVGIVETASTLKLPREENIKHAEVADALRRNVRGLERVLEILEDLQR